MPIPFRQGRRPCRKARPPLTDWLGVAQPAPSGGALLFGYFLLGKQEKVTRPPAGGRKPAAGEPGRGNASIERKHWIPAYAGMTSYGVWQSSCDNQAQRHRRTRFAGHFGATPARVPRVSRLSCPGRDDAKNEAMRQSPAPQPLSAKGKRSKALRCTRRTRISRRQTTTRPIKKPALRRAFPFNRYNQIRRWRPNNSSSGQRTPAAHECRSARPQRSTAAGL